MNQMSVPIPPRSRRPLASTLSILSTLLMTAIGIVLAWQVVTRSFADYLATVEPAWTLRLAPHNAEALLNLATEKLNRSLDPDASVNLDNSQASDDSSDGNTPVLSPEARAAADAIRARGVPLPMISPDISPQTRDDVRRLAKAALRRDPLDPRALRILGQTAGSEDRETIFMQAAAARSLHESAALYWLVQKSFLDGDFARTLTFADPLLRSQPQVADFVVPLFARIAEKQEGLAEIEKLLRSNPPWRKPFFGNFIKTVSDAHIPLAVMLDLQANGTPPEDKDVQVYIDDLMSRKMYSFAYYTWLQFLPPNRLNNLGLLFNGNFAFPPSGVPFDWKLNYNNGVEIDILENPDRPGQRALYWEFTDGPVDSSDVSQVVTLAPGSYSLHGLEKGDIHARRGLRWRVACYDAPAGVDALAASPALLGYVPDWKDFSMDFTVPAKNCAAQRIWLTIDMFSDPDRIASGSAWFGDISLSAKAAQ